MQRQTKFANGHFPTKAETLSAQTPPSPPTSGLTTASRVHPTTFQPNPTMAPVLPPQTPAPHRPRVVVYHQTHYHNGNFISILPLLTEHTGISHVIIAALHLNTLPGHITLNDDPVDAPKHLRVWDESRQLQAKGVKVLGMLGGAAPGTFDKLDRDLATFKAYYEPLRDKIKLAGLDGLDLDVEEPMSLPGIVRLISYLKIDFGPNFIITLAPVASALLGLKHLSGFSYLDLEKAMGHHISFYNTQFYNNWGSMASPLNYEAILTMGWPAEKVVAGVLTNKGNGHGWVEEEQLADTVTTLLEKHANFGGVMGWEYFNSVWANEEGEAPWAWAGFMGAILGSGVEE